MCLQLKCCGAVGPQDYYSSVWYNHTEHTMGGFVPASCCEAFTQAEHVDTDSTEGDDCQLTAAGQVFDQVFGPIYEDSEQTTKVRIACL